MRGFVKSHLGGLPAVYWIVWGGTLLNKLGGFVVPFLVLYLTDRVGMTLGEAGRVASLYGLGSLFAGLVGGAVSDRVGRKPTLTFGLGIGGLAMAGLGVSTQVHWIALFTFGVGFFSDLSRPAVSAMIADVVPSADRARAYGLLHWSINIGFSVAPLIAGYLATRNHYLALFLIDAATTLLYAVVVMIKVPETRPVSITPRPPLIRALATPVRDPIFMAFALLSFLLGLIFFQFEATLPADMRAHGVNPGLYGKLLAINGILIALLQPFSGRWVAGVRRSHVLVAAALLTGVGFALPAFLPTVEIFAIGIVIWTMGEILNAPIAPAIVADLAPEELRGNYQGLMQVMWGLAFFLAPALGTLVMERWGSRALWLGCLGLSAFVAVGHLAIAGARRRRVAALRLATPGMVSLVED